MFRRARLPDIGKGEPMDNQCYRVLEGIRDRLDVLVDINDRLETIICMLSRLDQSEQVMPVVEAVEKVSDSLKGGVQGSSLSDLYAALSSINLNIRRFTTSSRQ